MIYRLASYDRAFHKLTEAQQAAVQAAIGRAERIFGRPHLHAGSGLRPFGRYLEFRAGLKLRVLFLPQRGDLFLVTVGNHDQVAAYLRSNR